MVHAPPSPINSVFHFLIVAEARKKKNISNERKDEYRGREENKGHPKE